MPPLSEFIVKSKVHAPLESAPSLGPSAASTTTQ